MYIIYQPTGIVFNENMKPQIKQKYPANIHTRLSRDMFRLS